MPLFIEFIELKSSQMIMSLLHSMLAVFQISAYLQIYDIFYSDKEK